MNLSDSFWGELVAFILTVMVLSYLLGDNPAYRLAIHAFLGVAAAYVTIVTLQAVLIPRFIAVIDLATVGDLATAGLALIPWILAIFIVFRANTGLAPMGNTVIAFMVGVGAALAVGGAITGTIVPQVQASWDETNNLIVWTASVAGTTLVLLYFLYSGRTSRTGKNERPRFLLPLTWAGHGFLTVALAALYAGALAASFALFTERIGSMYAFLIGPDIKQILGLFGL